MFYLESFAAHVLVHASIAQSRSDRLQKEVSTWDNVNEMEEIVVGTMVEEKCGVQQP